MKVSMLRNLAIGATAALGLALIAPSANAQAQTSGFRAGIEGAFGNHDLGVGVGAFGKFHLTEVDGHAITGRVSFDYFFPSCSGCGTYKYHYWELAADGILDIVSSGDAKPYVAAGLTYWNSSFDSGYSLCGGIYGSCSTSSTQLHVAGGVNFMANSKLMPFVEIKLDVGNGSDIIFKGGIHFK